MANAFNRQRLAPAQRLARLMKETQEINTDMFGSDPKRWIQKVKLARNRVAHQLHGDEPLSEREQLVIANSLYWVLTVLMLRQCAVSDHDLSDALSKNSQFRAFLRQAQSWMPEVYSI
ncbi:MAG: HEPN domain-containing protein [Micromonosporaceae bacterium]